MDEDTGLNPAAANHRREFDSLSFRHFIGCDLLMAFTHTFNHYNDLARENQIKLDNLLVGVSVSDILAFEHNLPPSNATGVEPVHHPAVAYLMGLSILWAVAVQIACARAPIAS